MSQKSQTIATQRLFFMICLLISGVTTVLPQTPDTTRRLLKQPLIHESDTTITKQDRERYETVKAKAKKRRWTDVLYSILFSEPKKPEETETEGALDQQYRPYKGRVINLIDVVILDPFGTDINNPDSINTDNWFDKTADKMHITTKQYVVRSNLLFKAGDKVNPLVIAESEAFLRNTGYIHDARIRIDSIPGTNTANVSVIIRDVFSIGINIHSLSFKSIDLEVFDKNFLGSGNRIWLRGMHNSDYSHPFGFGMGYLYTNVAHTFINLNASYLDQIWSKETLLSAERPLQSSLHYYGQLAYHRKELRVDQVWDSISPPFQQDFTVSFGRAFDIAGKGSPQRFSVAASYSDNYVSYKAIAPYAPDPIQYEYTTMRSFITQYNFFSQRYYRQYLIHNFGVTENIAAGYNVSAQLGYTRCPGYFDGMYGSLDASLGNRFRFGNLYARASIGSHFDHSGFYQGILRINSLYFTPLFNLGKSRLRQFATVNYGRTLNPVDGITDYMYFSTLSTMDTDYFNMQAKGSERLMLNLETDIFTILNIVGFRVLVFSFFDGGWLKTDGKLLTSDNFYYGFGAGLRVRNDLLVFRTLALKIGYYPRLDQNMGNMFQFSTSEPKQMPGFIPAYPQELMLK